MKKSRIIPALILLVLLAAGSTALPGLFMKKEIEQKVTGYEMTGATMLTPEDYIRFTKASPEKGEYPDLNVLYDRLLNHPYIKSVEMELGEKGIAKINIVEQEIVLSVYAGDKLSLLTNELVLLPLMGELKNFDWPVIRNAKVAKASYFTLFRDSTILPGYKIAKACRLIGGAMATNLSEIDLRQGGDIVLVFSDMKPPVIFKKKGVAEQILILKQIREMSEQLSLNKEIEYIDLRYSGKIFLGKTKKMEKKDEKRDNNRA